MTSVNRDGGCNKKSHRKPRTVASVGLRRDQAQLKRGIEILTTPHRFLFTMLYMFDLFHLLLLLLISISPLPSHPPLSLGSTMLYQLRPSVPVRPSARPSFVRRLSVAPSATMNKVSKQRKAVDYR